MQILRLSSRSRIITPFNSVQGIKLHSNPQYIMEWCNKRNINTLFHVETPTLPKYKGDEHIHMITPSHTVYNSYVNVVKWLHLWKIYKIRLWWNYDHFSTTSIYIKITKILTSGDKFNPLTYQVPVLYVGVITFVKFGILFSHKLTITPIKLITIVYIYGVTPLNTVPFNDKLQNWIQFYPLYWIEWSRNSEPWSCNRRLVISVSNKHIMPHTPVEKVYILKSL